MAELTPEGEQIGTLFPVRVAELSRTANIREAVELLYYGNLNAHSLTSGQESQIPTQSIAGQLRDIGLTKLDKTNGIALGNFTVSNGSSPFIWLQGTTSKYIITGTPSGGDRTITLQNASGTVAFTNETQFSNLTSIDSLTTSHTFALAYGDPSAGNIKVVNIGTTSGSAAGATSINIGAQAGSSRTVGIMGTTTVNGTLTVTGAAQFNSTIIANSTIQGSSLIVGSSGPTITAGSGAPSGTPTQGSLHLRSGVAYTDALSVYASGGWRKMRGNMWFTGTENPGSLGEQAGDLYMNRVTGEIWVAS